MMPMGNGGPTLRSRQLLASPSSSPSPNLLPGKEGAISHSHLTDNALHSFSVFGVIHFKVEERLFLH